MKKVFFAVLLALSLTGYAYADATTGTPTEGSHHHARRAAAHHRRHLHREANAHHAHHAHQSIKNDHQQVGQ